MSATGERGFTLIEMLVVLAIAGLIGGIGVPRLQTAIAGAEARGVVGGIGAALRSARAAARLEGRPVVFVLARNGYGVAGAVVTTPTSVSLDGDPAISFYPDGSASGGSVSVAGEGKATRFEIAPATGLAQRR